MMAYVAVHLTAKSLFFLNREGKGTGFSSARVYGSLLFRSEVNRVVLFFWILFIRILAVLDRPRFPLKKSLVFLMAECFYAEVKN